MLLGIELEGVDHKDVAVTSIVTNPDNPYFKTGDKALFKFTRDWSVIKDGDFILIENDEGVVEGFDSIMLKVAYNKDDITLTSLSSFVPFEEKSIPFSEIENLKLVGKILGIFRSLGDEMRLDEFRMIPNEG